MEVPGVPLDAGIFKKVTHYWEEIKLDLINRIELQFVGSDNFDDLRGASVKGVVTLNMARVSLRRSPALSTLGSSSTSKPKVASVRWKSTRACRSTLLGTWGGRIQLRFGSSSRLGASTG